jgi:class 3 adenylate cyclase
VYAFWVKLNARTRSLVFIATGIIGLMCLIQMFHFEYIERLEGMTYDLRVREALWHSTPTATNLGFVAISDETIETLDKGLLGRSYGLAWPRHIYGRVVRELHTDGAKAVAFDILFGELRRDHAPILMAGRTNMESDDYFARQLGFASNVILAADQGIVPPALFRTNAEAIGDINAAKDRDGVLRRAKAFRTYRKWHRAFQQLADEWDYGVDLKDAVIEPNRIVLRRSGKLEPIIVSLDKDGKFDVTDLAGDKLPPGMARHDKPFTFERIWHMGIVLAAQQLKLDLTNAEVDLNEGRITLHGPSGLTRVIPVDDEGYMYINWRLTADDSRLTHEPFEALLSLDQMRLTGETNALADFWQKKEVDWRDKLVVVGSIATGNNLADRGATPLENDTILASAHWNVANSMLMDQFVRRASMPMELLLIALMSILAAVMAGAFRSSLTASLWVIFALVAYVTLACLVYVRYRYWVPVVMPVGGGLLITYFSMLAYLVRAEREERRRLRSAFTKMVSPDVVAELEQLHTEKLSLDGARRNVTVFFADIRGFTEMTDRSLDRAAEEIKKDNLMGDQAEVVFDLQARETLNTVNLYLKVIAETVLKHKGTIDKFMGDCVMAFWGAPIPNEHHAVTCVRAAIDAQRAVYHMNREREAENRRREAENARLAAAGQPPLAMLPILVVGTGINTGVVTAGYMGSEERLNYTVFGREVNLASRLEKESGRGRILVSEATLAEIIQDDPTLALACVELKPVPLKGFRTAVKNYEVPWREPNYAPLEIDALAATAGHDTYYLGRTEQPTG